MLVSVGGRVDINLADVALLQALPGIGPAIARRIVEYREMNGPFEAVDQLQKANGVGPVTFERIRDLISVGRIP